MTLAIYDVTLQMVRDVAPIARAVDRHDPDLARQLRRAATSVPLNTAEGAFSRGKNESARFQSAMGSAAEVGACLDVAEALGYANGIDPQVRARLGQIVATLRKLTKRG